MGAIQTVLPVLLDVGLDMAAGPSSSLSSRQLYLGPNGGTYYLTPGGNKRYV